MVLKVPTKWDLIDSATRTRLVATPTAPGMLCTGCGTPLETEAEFAQHFIVPDVRYLNLGECPETEKGKAILEAGPEIGYYDRKRET